MLYIKRTSIIFAVLITSLLTSCTSNEPEQYFPPMPGGQPGGGMIGSNTADDTTAPDIDATIYAYNGETATDDAADVVGESEDLFYELNDFSTLVEVVFDGEKSIIKSQNAKVITHQDGAHVVIDLLTNSVKNVNIVLRGNSSDGSLKVYGEKKFMLTLDGVDITSQRGAAINSQCKKRMFVHLKDGTINSLKDNASYKEDCYYPDGKTSADEDRKGCLFSEGNLIFSGKGMLKVAGLQKHGIATDGYFYMRPGVTIAVTEAAKNALHVKGDATDNMGVTINGGLLYTNVSSDAGKGIKTDMMVCINGGELMLNTSGKSVYDEEEKDTSSPSCIKADGDITITGGILSLKSTGTGGKGISTDAVLNISGGSTTITTTGGKFTYTNDLTSSPKGIKAEGDINITGGKLDISVTGKNDGSEGMESKANLTITDGEVNIYAYDDAINAGKSIVINGGKVFSHAVNNDGIDSNGTMTINGGLVIASGTNAPEGSFDSDFSQNFIVNGGTLIGIGGSCTTPSSGSKQNCLLYNGLTAAKDATLTICNSSNNTILSYKLHRTLTGLTLFVSDKNMTNGSYTIKANDEQIGTFSVNGVITTVGNVDGMNGGGPGGGFPGGQPGGR